MCIRQPLMVLALLLLVVPSVYSDDNDPESAIHQEHLIAKARQDMESSDFSTAAINLQRYLADPELNTSTRAEIRKLLDYELPVRRAQQAMVNNRPEEARRALELALQRTQAFPDENHKIRQLLSSLDLLQELPGNHNENAGKDTLDQLQKAIGKLYQAQGQLPLDLDGLQQNLPLDDLLHASYEIASYDSDGVNYRLVIRHRVNRNNVLSLNATGLVK